MKTIRVEQFEDLPEGQKFFFVRYDRVKPRGPQRLQGWREVYVKTVGGMALTTDGQGLNMPIGDDDLVIRVHPSDDGRGVRELPGVTVIR